MAAIHRHPRNLDSGRSFESRMYACAQENENSNGGGEVNKEVDEYIGKQKLPQKEICQELRRIIFRIFPHIDEELKWGVPTYAKGKYYIVSLKDHVNLGFSLKGLSKEEQKLFRGAGKTMKHIEIRSLKEIDESEIAKLLRLVWEKQ